MADPTPNRQQLENLWHERLHAAKLRLDFARQYRCEVQADRKGGDIPSSDGHYAFQRALRAENLALDEYRRVLCIFSDLVLRGKMPPL